MSEVFSVWFLIGAALVFWMQAGFTRAKNTGNIIMKNLMDFCIGIETAKKVLYTGHIGDGKIFVYDVENVIKIRTGEEGYDALQDVE